MLSSFFLENLVLCDHGASYDDISGIRPKSRNIRGAVCWYFLLLRTPLNEIRTLLSNVNLSRVLMWHITSLYLSFLLLAMRWLRRLWKDIACSAMPPWVLYTNECYMPMGWSWIFLFVSPGHCSCSSFPSHHYVINTYRTPAMLYVSNWNHS